MILFDNNTRNWCARCFIFFLFQPNSVSAANDSIYNCRVMHLRRFSLICTIWEFLRLRVKREHLYCVKDRCNAPGMRMVAPMCRRWIINRKRGAFANLYCAVLRGDVTPVSTTFHSGDIAVSDMKRCLIRIKGREIDIGNTKSKPSFDYKTI